MIFQQRGAIAVEPGRVATAADPTTGEVGWNYDLSVAISGGVYFAGGG